MKPCRILSDVASVADIEAGFEWYEFEQPGLGVEFLDEIRAAYARILDGPFKYQELRSGIRRALTRRFPYAVYFQWMTTSSSSLRSSIPPAIRLNGSSAFELSSGRELYVTDGYVNHRAASWWALRTDGDPAALANAVR